MPVVNNWNITNVEAVVNGLLNKVDKIAGKELSTNDFTDQFKLKLLDIEPEAQKNIQSDWDESNANYDAYIKNKPTIPIVNNGLLTLDYFDGATTTTLGSFSANQSNPLHVRIDTSKKVDKTDYPMMLYGTNPAGEQATYPYKEFGSIDGVTQDGVNVVETVGEDKVAKIKLDAFVKRTDVPKALSYAAAGRALLNTDNQGVMSATSGALRIETEFFNVLREISTTGLTLTASSLTADQVHLKMGTGAHVLGLSLSSEGIEIVQDMASPAKARATLPSGGNAILVNGTMQTVENLVDVGFSAVPSHTKYPSEYLTKLTLDQKQNFDESLYSAGAAFHGPNATPVDNGSLYLPKNKGAYSVRATLSDTINIAVYSENPATSDAQVDIGNLSVPTLIKGSTDGIGIPQVYLGVTGSDRVEEKRILTKSQTQVLIDTAIKGSSRFRGVFNYFGSSYAYLNSKITAASGATDGQTAIVADSTLGSQGWQFCVFSLSSSIWMVYQDLPYIEPTDKKLSNGDWFHVKRLVVENYSTAEKDQKATIYYHLATKSLEFIQDDYDTPDEIDTTSQSADPSKVGFISFKRKLSGGKQVLNDTDADGILYDKLQSITIKGGIDSKVNINQGVPNAGKIMTVNAVGNIVPGGNLPALPPYPVETGRYALEIVLTPETINNPTLEWVQVVDRLQTY